MSEPRLVARLGLVDATAIALGAMFGAGVFVALGQAAGLAGSALPLAIVIGWSVATLSGLSAAQLGVAYPRAGGTYEFGYQLLAPLAGFLAGWLFLLAGVTASATYGLTFASYIGPLLPGVPPHLVGVLAATGAVAANLAGVSVSARANLVLVALKVGSLVAFVVLGVAGFDPDRLGPLLPAGPIGLVHASALMFFAYTGFARPVTIAEEVREPQAVLPRAVALALAITMLLYLGVGLVALGLAGPESLGESPAPLRDALAMAHSAVGVVIVSVGAVAATANVLLTEIWGLSRLLFSMGRRGDLPSLLARTSEDGVPRYAVILTGAAVLLPTALVDLRPVLDASSLALLLYYALTNLAALRLEESKRQFPPAIPAAGLVTCLLLATSLPWTTLLAVGVMVAVGAILFWTRRRSIRVR